MSEPGNQLVSGTTGRHIRVLAEMRAAKGVYLKEFEALVEVCIGKKESPCSKCREDKESDCTHEICAVCLEAVDIDDDIENPICFVGSCKHVFHALCLGMWIEKARTCPQCRAQACSIFQYRTGVFSPFMVAETIENRTFTNYDVEQYVVDEDEHDDGLSDFIDDDVDEDDDDEDAPLYVQDRAALNPIVRSHGNSSQAAAPVSLTRVIIGGEGAGQQQGVTRHQGTTILDVAPKVPLFMANKKRPYEDVK